MFNNLPFLCKLVADCSFLFFRRASPQLITSKILGCLMQHIFFADQNISTQECNAFLLDNPSFAFLLNTALKLYIYLTQTFISLKVHQLFDLKHCYAVNQCNHPLFFATLCHFKTKIEVDVMQFLTNYFLKRNCFQVRYMIYSSLI